MSAPVEKAVRPISTISTSSQLSISDRMTDGDEEDIRLPSSASSEVGAPPQPTQPPKAPSPRPGSKVSQTPARTTTISTIAMESNTSPPGTVSKCSPTRLVIALLETPHRGLQLKVIELFPPLLKLPDSLQDAEEFLKNHSQCIKNLQSKQSPVEELLRQADNLIATQKPRAEVYAAMADSLGQTWKDLNGILEERRIILQLATGAHGNIFSCLQKMDQLHAYHSRLSYLGGLTIDDHTDTHAKPEPFSGALEKLQRLKSDRAEVLRSLALCLESCDTLLNKIAGYNYTIDSRDLVLVKDVEFATRQVHRWLERLHDRRVILEERLRNRREELEELYNNSKFDQEIQNLTSELGSCTEFCDQFNFGDSEPSAAQRGEGLAVVEGQLKILQERALSTAKSLQDSEEYGRWSQKSVLKNKIYAILSQTSDLLNMIGELGASLSDAKEFFRLGQEASDKLDGFFTTDPQLGAASSSEGKTEVNAALQTAIDKGQGLLSTWGWDSPKTKGVRALHDALKARRAALLEELEHLAVLDEYNDFLASVNQTYQNVLNIETSEIRQPLVVPPTPLKAVQEFTTASERLLTHLRSQLGLSELLSKLENIYPDLSEEEKVGSEIKINSLKTLSNQIVALCRQRSELGEKWGSVLAIYGGGGKDKRERVEEDLEQIKKIAGQDLQPLLAQIHASDPDLITEKMETELDRILKELEAQKDSFQSNDRIRDICQKYKVQLDHHLLGDGVGTPQYYPVLSRSIIETAFDPNLSKVTSLTQLVEEVIKPKLEHTLIHFFQPLLTSYREDILAVSDPSRPSAEKTREEQDFERYCSRLKESYGRVTTDIESYLTTILPICKSVEDYLTSGPSSSLSVEDLQKRVQDFDTFRQEISSRIQSSVAPRFDQLLQTIREEEPPQQGAEEMDSLRLMMAQLGHDQEFDGARANLVVGLREAVVQNDLTIISNQLQYLIVELEQPTNYGNCFEDAQENLENYSRFEETIEKLRERLMEMLATSAIGEDDAHGAALRAKLQNLKERRAKRKGLILMSIEYFRLIDESYSHYDLVNEELAGICKTSKGPDIGIPEIEQLLQKLKVIQAKEQRQERRLSEIERIAGIIFDTTQTSSQDQHLPLRQKNAEMTGELLRVESDLTELLGVVRSRCSSFVGVPPASDTVQVIPPAKSPTTSILEVRERQETLSVVSTTTMRRSLSPGPSGVSTLEKQTQFENGDEPSKPYKVERDTLTQTLEGKSSSCKTQTDSGDGKRPLSQAIHDPAILEPLKDVVANEGERVELECKATGAVDHVTWLKDGVDLTNMPGYVTQFQSDSVNSAFLIKARLWIERVVSGDDGAIFTVRAIGGENNSVTVETSGKLTVVDTIGSTLARPSFQPHPPISLGTHGKGHTVQLRVDGNPLPTVQWFKNGVCIDTSPDYVITFNNGLCQVNFEELLKDVDEGLYSCSATNKIGQAETHVALQIKGGGVKKETPKQKPRILRPLPKSVTVLPGQALRLEVEYESPSEVNILWFKDDNKVLTSANCSAQMTTTGSLASLAFSKVSPAVSGKYTILLRNSAGEVQSEVWVRVDAKATAEGSPLPPETISETSASKPATETLIQASDNRISLKSLPVNVESPRVKMGLKEQETTINGDRLQLDCVIVGQPEPEVIWYKDSIPIKESPNHHLQFTGDRCSLVIKAVSPQDSGKYSVVAVNPGGEVTSSCQVIVTPSLPPPVEVQIVEEDVQELEGKEDEPEDGGVVEAPKFQKIIEDEMITEGDLFQFQVQLEPHCDKTTDVVWFKNNKKVQGGDGIQFVRDIPGKSYSLIFNPVKLTDKGNYLAKASNSGGDSKCFACLIVKENLELQKSGSDVVRPPPPPVPRPSVATSKPARFLVPLEGRMVDEGDYNVSLKCVVEANPPAIITWNKNNAPDSLLPSSNLEQHYNERTGEVELILKKVATSDAGRYSVTARNDFGLANSVSDLVVKKIAFPPVFSKRLQSLSLEEGKRLYLEVDVYGKPAPEIVWTLNNRKLGSESEDFIMKSDTPTRHSLIVAKVESGTHGGEYTVTAKNEAGEASSSCTVKVVPGQFVPAFKTPPPPVPPKPSKISIPTPSPEPQILHNVPSLARMIAELPPPLDVGGSITREMSRYESTSISTSRKVVPQPEIGLQDLEPGPPPQLLIAPSPTKDWSRSEERRNQLQEMVKNFEEQRETPDLSSPPSGGVRLIPIKESTTQPPKVVDLPILPLQPFPFSTPLAPQLTPASILIGEGSEPKQYFDSSWSSSNETTALPGGGTQSSQSQSYSATSSQVKLIKPSKFIPEKMRESDYDSSDVEGPIPVKWAPRTSPMSPTPAFQPMSGVPPQNIPPSTSSSAFAPCKPGGATTSLYSSSSGQQTFSSFQSTATFPTFVRPTVPPKPRGLSPLSPGPMGRSIGKSWPSQEPEQSSSLLSPGGGGDARNLRSPTPSREGLEMDKLWSRPIRFSSPTGIRSPPLSPRPEGTYPAFSSPPPPPPKPIDRPQPPTLTSSQRAGGYSTPVEMSSPIPPPMSPRGDRGEPLYYVSVVSTPRTTPIPSAFSPPPDREPFHDLSASTVRNFQEKKSFFEQSSSSYASTEERSSSFHKISSVSTSSLLRKDPRAEFFAMDTSFLPPPGEAPEFLYAAPPARPQPQKPKMGASSTGPGSSSVTQQFSSSSITMSSTFSKGSKDAAASGKQKQVPHRVDILRHEIHVTPPTPPPASTSSSSQILPYIKPSVFTPASIPDTHPSSETHLWEVIPPTWNPDGTTLTTTWRRVSYAPRSEWRKSLPTSLPPPRNPLTLLVEERMSDLNARFKDNIKNNATLFSQGLSYNKSDREITSQLEPCKGNIPSSVEANPLIYFKYDFGYEFGIADPTSVIVRGASEPRENFGVVSLPGRNQDKRALSPDSGLIHIPITHEKTGGP